MKVLSLLLALTQNLKVAYVKFYDDSGGGGGGGGGG